MLHDEQIDHLRALVRSETPLDPPSKVPSDWSRYRRRITITLAVLSVAASAAFAGWAVWTETLGRSEAGIDEVVASSSTTASATAAVATPIPQPGDGGEGDLFENLRRLPAASVHDLQLTAIVRTPASTQLAAFIRVDRGDRLTGVVLVDAVSGQAVEGAGVIPSQAAEIDGRQGTIINAGLERAQIIEVQSPSLGAVRVNGFGTTSTELDLVARAAAGMLDPGVSPSPSLPSEWAAVLPYGGPGAVPTWRAFFTATSGETVVLSLSGIATDSGPGPDDFGCYGETPCSVVGSSSDGDGTITTVFASADRVAELQDALRGVSATNAQVRSLEFEPFAEIDPAEAAQMLYLPVDLDGWQVTETLVHSSGRLIVEPALVLIERSTPEIGPITAVVVVRPVGGVPNESSDDSGAERLPTIESGRPFELLGWNHSMQELGLIGQLLTVDGNGLNFASRAGDSLGLDRQYDDILLDPFPASIVEGPVFGAVVVDSDGIETTIRVSRVSDFVPEAVAVRPHINERVLVIVRSKVAALIVADDGATLEWEEQPGVLIRLSGASDEALLHLAGELEPVRVSDLAS